MKKIIIPFLSILLITTYSCYKDYGNYEYDDLEVIKIDSIESKYTGMTGVDRLLINPVVTSTDPEAEFEYAWFVYQRNTSGKQQNDTIATTKDLDFVINLRAGSWELKFSAKNLNTGCVKYQSSVIESTTEFSKGWFVSTDDGTNSDIHLFYTVNNKPLELDGRVAYNLMSNMNENPTAGTDGVFLFMNNYKTYNEEEGVFVDTRVLFHYTEQAVNVIDATSFRVLYTFDDLFYTPPVKKGAKSIVVAANTMFLNAGSELYDIFLMSFNNGLFGESAWIDDAGTPFNLSKFSSNSFRSLFYDTESTSFVQGSSGGYNLKLPKDNPNTDMSAQNTGKKLKFMQVRNPMSATAVAVFEDIEDPSLKILSKIQDSSLGSFTIVNDTLDVNDQLYHATVYGQCYYWADVLYFSAGSEVWLRNLANGMETVQFTAPDGEEVVYIAHQMYWGKFDHIFVATQAGDTYKVYMFKRVAAGQLNTEPDMVLTGTGQFSDIMYIDPYVRTDTYNYLTRWSN